VDKVNQTVKLNVLLLPWEELISFSDGKFCGNHSSDHLSKLEFEKKQGTFATCISYFCICHHVSKLKAESRMPWRGRDTSYDYQDPGAKILKGPVS
jgi:hypothetical protein